MLQENLRRATDHIGRGSFDPALAEGLNVTAITRLRSALDHLADVDARLALDDGGPAVCKFVHEHLDGTADDVRVALAALGITVA